jgi:hypothetical protein
MRARNLVLPCALVAALSSSIVSAQEPGLEYRLKTPDGMPVYWRDGTEILVSKLPFLARADVASVTISRSKNPNSPGAAEIVLTHTPLGRAKFKAVADADRSRQYCILFRLVVLQCSGYPIDDRPLHDRDAAIYAAMPGAEVEALVREIRRSK